MCVVFFRSLAKFTVNESNRLDNCFTYVHIIFPLSYSYSDICATHSLSVSILCFDHVQFRYNNWFACIRYMHIYVSMSIHSALSFLYVACCYFIIVTVATDIAIAVAVAVFNSSALCVCMCVCGYNAYIGL